MPETTEYTVELTAEEERDVVIAAYMQASNNEALAPGLAKLRDAIMEKADEELTEYWSDN